MFLEDPALQDDLPISYLSHKELYEHSLRKACIIGVLFVPRRSDVSVRYGSILSEKTE